MSTIDALEQAVPDSSARHALPDPGESVPKLALETLFEQMYRRYRAGLAPDHLMVEHRAPAPHAASTAELCS